MRVLVTGASGFLGTMLARELLARGGLDDGGGERGTLQLVLNDIAEPDEVFARHPAVTTVSGDLAEDDVLDRICADGLDAVFHLAALVSGGAEADFAAGMHANIDATCRLLERCRLLGNRPRLVFSSSIAVYGGDLPKVIDDRHHLVPESSYGAQKAVGEMLVNEYSRRGFIDGRSVRLPVIAIRPGAANTAASSWASAIVREPLAGRVYACPVEPDDTAFILSPRQALAGLIRAYETEEPLWRDGRAVMMPGTVCRARDLVAALKRATSADVTDRIRWKPDLTVRGIVGTWPVHFRLQEGPRLGFEADPDIDSIVLQYVKDIETAGAA